MSSGNLQIQTFTSEGFGQNGFLVRCGDAGPFVAIDPGDQAGVAMADAIDDVDGELQAILLTHAHLDHIQGVGELLARREAPIYLHPDDLPLYRASARQAEMFGMDFNEPPPVDRRWKPGRDFRFGDCSFEVRHVPGHSPGHVLLFSADAELAFIGDVVFAGSIGRTDLPGGDYQQLMASIREQVLTLPDETTLYSGHGPPTTIGHERVGNPFLAPLYGGGLA